MKIIHSSDIHLGSKINSKFKSISNDRKLELRNSFLNMCNYAKNNDVKVILLSGDIFDENTPSKKDKDNFYSVISNYPNIDFLYLKGNHDLYENNNTAIPNLKTFSSTLTSYNYDNITISGLELNKENSNTFYHTIKLNPNQLNILMLHGTISSSKGENLIDISALKNKNIDYLALGHIHSYKTGKIDSRGIYSYCGCLEGRGFDEEGKKGFVLLDINDKITYEFIPFQTREIHINEFDISSCFSISDVTTIINNNININYNDIYRFILKGELSCFVSFNKKDIEQYFNNLYFLEVIDNTNIKIDINKYLNDISLKGEFVRSVLNDEELKEDVKNEVLTLGLRLLEGREIDL